ncbi:heparan-alpha-glucosaminide N-acetyltransferase domain-containing protein [Aquimarina aquimarini]|uniref:heparan-alpha-glucosaminide N-acetyltransferase domain-containing protein n=1 Tax=Aquimarina aquimarini TaxID=1191734 RepID=UPI000D5625F5|nr:heparan-alpha-glucosaminide N-acetyltransferase domain-containing protein [Aquimarina aquimarini]
MSTPANRLHFLDAIRAFAILMMLQGHFVHCLLGNVYRDQNSFGYTFWEYFRGMTAPTFFTITGFIFTYLLLKQEKVGIDNPRVVKGIKRGVKVIFYGYLLRLSFYDVINGTINPSFFYIDVLQCIGASLLLLIAVYLVFYNKNQILFQNIILCIGVMVFLLQPIYGSYSLDFFPKTIANYFTDRNGSVFTLFPWFGYVCFGSFVASLFLKFKEYKRFYSYAILILLSIGVVLVFSSSSILMLLYDVTGIVVFKSVAYNNFLFIRLGNVCVLFSIFIMIRKYFGNKVISMIGGKTLPIYIIHFFVLYGSWFGLGLNSFFYRSLTPMQAFVGAILFVIGVCVLVLQYYKHEKELMILIYRLWGKVNKMFKKVLPESCLLFIDGVVRRYRSIRFVKR